MYLYFGITRQLSDWVSFLVTIYFHFGITRHQTILVPDIMIYFLHTIILSNVLSLKSLARNWKYQRHRMCEVPALVFVYMLLCWISMHTHNQSVLTEGPWYQNQDRARFPGCHVNMLPFWKRDTCHFHVNTNYHLWKSHFFPGADR